MTPYQIVAASLPWYEKIFSEDIEVLPGVWTYVQTPLQLEQALISNPNIQRIYFLHWSWKVPDSLTNSTECINFHMTDLPYGRGGSPLQNLILSGKTETSLSAIRMINELDAGPIYLKRPLHLHGTAEAIYERAGRLAAQMVSEIESKVLEPTAQQGEPTFFKRRSPSESQIGTFHELVAIYDFIRMLDAQTYPKAFFDLGGLRFEFSGASLYSSWVKADVKIFEKGMNQ